MRARPTGTTEPDEITLGTSCREWPTVSIAMPRLEPFILRMHTHQGSRRARTRHLYR